MESERVRLRKKRGQGWAYEEIEIPTDAEMQRIAAALHAERRSALIDCLGWKVLYVPAFPLTYSKTQVDLFSGERGETTRHQSTTISYCEFGRDAEWTVCYSWNRGDDQAPQRIQVKGDVVPVLPQGQGILGLDDHMG